MIAPHTAQIIDQVRQGKSNKQIARDLADEFPDLTPEKVRNVVRAARRLKNPKLGAGVAGRRHTPLETVKAALARARETSVMSAAREFGIERRTIQRWRKRFGV